MPIRIILTVAALLLIAIFFVCYNDTRDASPEPLHVAVTITDAATGAPVQAAIFADGQRVALDVSAYMVNVPGDGQRHELRVEAPGYQVWSIKLAGELRPGRGISGPVRLQRLPSDGNQASRTPAFAIASLST